MRWARVSTTAAPGADPGPRSSHSACAIGGDFYVYGGELEPRKPVDACLFRLRDGTWTKVAGSGDGPGPRIAAGMAAIGSKIYLFGGRTGVEMGEGARDDIWALDTAAAEPAWSVAPVSSGAPPPARSYHAVAAAGSQVYVFGGCGAAGRLADLWCYDPDASAWVELPAAPAGVLPRGGASLVASAAGDRLFVLGGFSGKELGDAHAYDIPSGRWLCAPAAGGDSSCGGCAAEIRPRSVFGAAVHACGGGGAGACGHGGHVLVFGGEVDPSTQGHAGAGGFSDEVFCVDPSTKECHALDVAAGAAAAPRARGWFACAAPGGRLMLYGGLDRDNTRLADVWVLEH